jgi:O-antigen/teichoic acid export membrane protein
MFEQMGFSLRGRVRGRLSSVRTTQGIAWNYAGYLYQLGVNFGLTSWVVRHLEVTEYGLFVFIISLSGFLYLLDFGMSSLLIQTYVGAAVTTDKQNFTDLLSTTLLVLAGLGTVGVLIFAGLTAILPGPFNIPHQYLGEARVLFVVAALVIQASLPAIALDHAYQAVHRFDRINKIQFVATTFQLVATVSVLLIGYRIVAMALAQLATAVLRLILLWVALPSTIPGVRLDIRRFDRRLLKPFVGSSGWAFLNNVAVQSVSVLSWLILGSFTSMKAAALFGLASKLPTQLSNFVDKGAIVILPMFSKSHAMTDRQQLQETYLTAQRLIFAGVLPAVLLGCVCARPLIEVWAGREYASAAPVMQWLLLAAFAQAIGYSSDSLLYACGEIRKAARIAMLGGFASIVLGLPLVSRYGAAGLAAGMAVSQLLISTAWLTASACRTANLSSAAVVKAVFSQLAWPFATLAAAIGALRGVWAFLPPSGRVVAGAGCGCVYFAVWSLRMTIPTWGLRAENVD